MFRLLLETMERLFQGCDNELVLRYFELNLLERVGYRPQLLLCVSCRLPLKPVTNSFCSSAGGMLCPSCTRSQPLSHPVSVNGLKVLRLLQDTDYSTAGRLRINQELSRELERLMRNYLSYLLEREVKSAAWLDTLRQLSK